MKSLSWAEMDNMSETQLIERIRSLEHELAKPQLEPEGELCPICKMKGKRSTPPPQQPSEKETMFIETKENDATHVVLEYGTNKSCGAKKLTPQQPSDSAGEEVNVFTESLDRFCPHLTPKAMMYWKEGAEFIRDRIKKLTRPTVSEEEMEKLNPWIKGNSKYYTPWEMGFKAAIKELLNR